MLFPITPEQIASLPSKLTEDEILNVRLGFRKHPYNHAPELNAWEYRTRLLAYFGWTRETAPSRIEFSKEFAEALIKNKDYVYLALSSHQINAAFFATLCELDILLSLAKNKALLPTHTAGKRLQRNLERFMNPFRPLPEQFHLYFQVWLGVFGTLPHGSHLDLRQTIWKNQITWRWGGAMCTMLQWWEYILGNGEYLPPSCRHLIPQEDESQPISISALDAGQTGGNHPLVFSPGIRSQSDDLRFLNATFDYPGSVYRIVLEPREDERCKAFWRMHNLLRDIGIDAFRELETRAIVDGGDYEQYLFHLPDYEEEMAEEQHLANQYEQTRNAACSQFCNAGLCVAPNFFAGFRLAAIATIEPLDAFRTLSRLGLERFWFCFPFFDTFFHVPRSHATDSAEIHFKSPPATFVQLIPEECIPSSGVVVYSRRHGMEIEGAAISIGASKRIGGGEKTTVKGREEKTWDHWEQQLESHETHSGCSFQHFTLYQWGMWGAPDMNLFLDFFQAFYRQQDPQIAIVVCCRGGVGRTGTFNAIFFGAVLLESLVFGIPLRTSLKHAWDTRRRHPHNPIGRLSEEQCIKDPIAWIVDELREARPGAVEGVTQYTFIYTFLKIVYRAMKAARLNGEDEMKWKFGPRSGKYLNHNELAKWWRQMTVDFGI